jgi:hypothetical protein
MDNESTTIKLKKDFKRFLDTMGDKGQSYQDILIEAIFKLPAEEIEERLKKCAYDYHELAKRLGVKLKK